MSRSIFFCLLLLCSMLTTSMQAGDTADAEPVTLEVTPTELTLKIGEKTNLQAQVKDKLGNPVEREVLFFSRSRRSVNVTPAGTVEALGPGEFILIALVPLDPENKERGTEALLRVEIPVKIPLPPLKEIQFENVPKHFYAGTRLALDIRAEDTTGTTRPDASLTLKSAKEKVATVEGAGQLALLSPGKVRLTVTSGDISKKLTINVEANPIKSFTLSPSQKQVRTGDVIHFEARAQDASGKDLEDVPVFFAVQGTPHDHIVAPGATAQIDADGMFVAERSGKYTVVAFTGSHVAMGTVEVSSRDIAKDLVKVGHGPVRDQHTSDLWVWEAANGRDYAITGTWGAGGHAKIWDVTDPESIALVDTVKVDARTVNDVKVSEDGRIAVICREGASNRKNGIVILDVSEPELGVRILSTFDDQLNGGVHNAFIYENHVYALSDSTRYDIINIEDPKNPHRVGRFELDSPGHGIHDVWVVDGVAWSSNWADGVVAVDVGGAGKGGSPSNPVELGRYTHPSGWNHAAFPYRSKSTGKFYLFAGDEAFPYGLHTEPDEVPNRAAGWIHVVEWDDWENPREVARFALPGAGTHNFWIEDDILYVAFYNGGVRVVDVSGELRGDLYRQGREIAHFIPTDHKGYIANAPFTWGPQPYKGHVFISDWNSGIWSLKLTEPERKKDLGEPQ